MKAFGYRLPMLDWLSSYRRDWLRPDIVAGMTTAAVVIPKAMAYATIAGLPVEVGLYTAFVPLIVYAVLGTSRPMSVTTTTTIAILVGTELGIAVPGGDPAALLQATALLTLMVGAILVLASVLRLGFVANFISEPVLIGFKAGIGVVIIVDQLPKILGIHFAKGSFLENVQSIFSGLSDVSIATLVVGVLTIALLAVIERFRPRWPAPLIVIAHRDRLRRRVRVAGTRHRDRGRDSVRIARLADARIRAREPALAGGARHRAHELHGIGSGRPRVRANRRADAAAQRGAFRDRHGERSRRFSRIDAGRRRHEPDQCQSNDGRAHAAVEPDHRRDDAA